MIETHRDSDVDRMLVEPFSPGYGRGPIDLDDEYCSDASYVTVDNDFTTTPGGVVHIGDGMIVAATTDQRATTPLLCAIAFIAAMTSTPASLTPVV